MDEDVNIWNLLSIWKQVW